MGCILTFFFSSPIRSSLNKIRKSFCGCPFLSVTFYRIVHYRIEMTSVDNSLLLKWSIVCICVAWNSRSYRISHGFALCETSVGKDPNNLDVG